VGDLVVSHQQKKREVTLAAILKS